MPARRVRKALEELIRQVEDEVLYGVDEGLGPLVRIRLRGAVAHARQELRWADAEAHARVYGADSSGSRGKAA